MTTLVGHFFRRMMTRGRVIGLIALSSVAGLVIWLSSGSDFDDAEAVYPFAITTAGFTFAIAVLILTVGTLRDERDAGTLPYIYMKPIPRSRFAVASIAGGALTAIAIGIAPAHAVRRATRSHSRSARTARSATWLPRTATAS